MVITGIEHFRGTFQAAHTIRYNCEFAKTVARLCYLLLQKETTLFRRVFEKRNCISIGLSIIKTMYDLFTMSSLRFDFYCISIKNIWFISFTATSKLYCKYKDKHGHILYKHAKKQLYMISIFLKPHMARYTVLIHSPLSPCISRRISCLHQM